MRQAASAEVEPVLPGADHRSSSRPSEVRQCWSCSTHNGCTPSFHGDPRHAGNRRVAQRRTGGKDTLTDQASAHILTDDNEDLPDLLGAGDSCTTVALVVGTHDA
jgi:hypothetical protein